MEKLYFIVTADELEWPIAVGNSIEELARDTGKSVQALKWKITSQKRNLKAREYKVEVVKVKEQC